MLAKLNQNRDQVLSQIRDEYRDRSESGRRAFRKWVEKLAQAGQPPVYQSDLNMGVQVYMHVRSWQEPGQERVTISPATLLKALEAWDSGEQYIHSGFDW